MRRVEQQQSPCIVVDLRELSFIGACGVSRLIAAQRAGRRLVLVRGRAIEPLLTLTRLEQTLEVVNDISTVSREPPEAARWSSGGCAGAPDRRRGRSQHARR